MDFIAYISKYKVSTRKDLPQNNITHIVFINSSIISINIPKCRHYDFITRINNISEDDMRTLNIKIFSLK